jgi:hypothetical protein
MDMPELAEVETPKTAGFVNPSYSNRNRKRIDEEEEELKNFEADSKEEVAEEEPTDTEDKEETLSREEKSFKKRYGDLRRHMSEKEKEWKEKFEGLESRLEDTSIIPPKSDEDIAQWASKYPDVAGIVETIATKKAQEMFSKAEQRLEQIDAKEAEMSRASAEDTIRKAHSDFDKLRQSDKFHDWVDEQPKWVQDALYENADDPDSVIRVIDLYKVDNGMTKSDYAAKRRAAASTVKKGSRTKLDAEETNGSIKESDVANMSAKEFQNREEEITKAIQSGKFIYDMSGSAR